jgi:replicative DNA helicase
MLDLMAANPITNTDAYVNSLIDMSQKRSLAMIASSMKQQIVEEDASPLEVIDETIKRVERVAESGSIIIKRKCIKDTVEKEPEFICKSWLPIPKGTTSMIVAPGGTGKTWLILQLAIRAAKEDRNNKVFLWLSEDPEGIVKNRYDAIKKNVLTGVYDVDDQITISTEDPLLLLETHGNTAKLSAKFYAMKRELREYSTIVIDPLLAFYGGDENNNSQARVFMQPFLNWARSENKSIIFLHHSKKGEGSGGSKARGAGAIIDAVRCVYDMDKITVRKDEKQVPDPQHLQNRRFTLTKDNYGASRYTDGFMFEREVTPKSSARVIEVEYEDGITFDLPTID